MSTREQIGNIPRLTLGWRLRMSLESSGVTVQQMADELGVERRTPGRWMHDQGTPPRAAFVKQWALRTGVPYEWLATGTASPDGPDGESGDAPTGVSSLPTGRRTGSAPKRRIRHAA